MKPKRIEKALESLLFEEQENSTINRKLVPRSNRFILTVVESHQVSTLSLVTNKKRILKTMKNPRYVPVLWNGNLTFSLLFDMEKQEIQEKEEEEEDKSGGERLLSSGLDVEEDLALQQSLLNSFLSSSTTLNMPEPESESESESESFSTQYWKSKDLNMAMFESDSESKSCSSTQDLKRKGVDRSSSLSLVYENPQRKYYRGESSYMFCAICKEVAPNRALVEINKCNHSFCRDCVSTYLGEKIQENIAEVKCPKPKCKAVLDPKFCQQFVPHEVFWRWVNALAESSVLAYQTYLDCPFEDCEERFVDDERGFKIRACPKCWRLFCVVCKTAWHMGQSCWEFQMELEVERARRRRRRRGGWPESDYRGVTVYILE